MNLKLKKISPSGMNTYLTCPKKFYYIKMGLPRLITPMQKALEIGREIHDLIAKYYERIERENLSPTETQVGEMISMMGKDYKRLGGTEDINKIVRLIKGFAKFEKWRQEEGWKPIETEIYLRKSHLVGKIDAIFKKGKEKLVVDWKTGFSFITSHADRIQLGVYKMLTGIGNTMIVKLVYGRRLRMEPNTEKVKETIRTVWNDIIQDKFPRKKGKHCGVCEFNVLCWVNEENVDVWGI